MLSTRAPAPADTGLWIHIGANVAVNRISIANGVASAERGPAASRTLQVTDSVVAGARQAFSGVTGYDTPAQLSRRAGLGETKEYLDAGYTNILGMVGENPLFHTPLDRAALASSPEVLEPVARALRRFVEHYFE
jgi:hypothetical protein